MSPLKFWGVDAVGGAQHLRVSQAWAESLPPTLAVTRLTFLSLSLTLYKVGPIIIPALWGRGRLVTGQWGCRDPRTTLCMCSMHKPCEPSLSPRTGSTTMSCTNRSHSLLKTSSPRQAAQPAAQAEGYKVQLFPVDGVGPGKCLEGSIGQAVRWAVRSPSPWNPAWM